MISKPRLPWVREGRPSSGHQGRTLGSCHFYLVGSEVKGECFHLACFTQSSTWKISLFLVTVKSIGFPPNQNIIGFYVITPTKILILIPKGSHKKWKIPKVLCHLPLAMPFPVPGSLALKGSISPTWLCLLASKTIMAPVLHMTHT